MNVIDIGCSYIKAYLFVDDRVVNSYKLPTQPDRLFNDTLICFEQVGLVGSQTTIVLSTSDSIVWEDKDGNAQWVEHATPPFWTGAHTPYTKSGHPRYDLLQGAANQMIWLQQTKQLKNIKRILPLSAYIATVLADNPDWNGWDITHATNSGFWDYTTGTWANEAQAFIEAGLIDEKVYPCNEIIEGNSQRVVFLGGHDSVFSNANDNPYSTKPYVSCGTWTTLSVEYDMDMGIPDNKNSLLRYIAAPNGTILKQLCYPSTKKNLAVTGANVDNWIRTHELSNIRLFGSWSKELYDEMKDQSKITWEEPNRFFGCTHLPEQAFLYAKNSKGYIKDEPYFCEGA